MSASEGGCSQTLCCFALKVAYAGPLQRVTLGLRSDKSLHFRQMERILAVEGWGSNFLHLCYVFDRVRRNCNRLVSDSANSVFPANFASNSVELTAHAQGESMTRSNCLNSDPQRREERERNAEVQCNGCSFGT